MWYSLRAGVFWQTLKPLVSMKPSYLYIFIPQTHVTQHMVQFGQKFVIFRPWDLKKKKPPESLETTKEAKWFSTVKPLCFHNKWQYSKISLIIVFCSVQKCHIKKKTKPPIFLKFFEINRLVYVFLRKLLTTARTVCKSTKKMIIFSTLKPKKR